MVETVNCIPTLNKSQLVRYVFVYHLKNCVTIFCNIHKCQNRIPFIGKKWSNNFLMTYYFKSFVFTDYKFRPIIDSHRMDAHSCIVLYCKR